MVWLPGPCAVCDAPTPAPCAACATRGAALGCYETCNRYQVPACPEHAPESWPVSWLTADDARAWNHN